MKLIFLFFLLFNNNDTLTLRQCYEDTYKSYPETEKIQLYNSSSGLKLSNLGVNYYPQFSIKGSATYQSDVPKIDISSPFFKSPELSKDRYQLTLDIKQIIFDGGNTGSLKEYENKQLLVDRQKVEVELYSLRQKINDLYFGALLLQEKKNITRLLFDDIKQRISEISSKTENGILPKSSLYALQAQLIQAEQELQNIEADRISTINMLGIMMGRSLDENTILLLPDVNYKKGGNSQINRPEYKLFELQKNQIDALKEITITTNIPRLNAFGQLGYGRPGLNMLDNSFKTYYLFGLNLSWNPYDWNSKNYQIQIYDVNKKIIDKQKETFDINLKITIEKYKSDILKYEQLLDKDDEIISLRDKVTASYASQLQNGIITSSVYLTELNNKIQSLLIQKTHQIQLIQSKINLLTIRGIKLYD